MSGRETVPSAWLPAAVGALLVAVHVGHLAGATAALTGGILEAIPPVVASLALAAAGVGFAARAPAANAVARVNRWLLLGAGGALLVGLWTAGHLLTGGRPVEHLPFLLSGNVAAGAVMGFVVGLYDGRARRREEQVERTRVRARAERDRFAALFDNVRVPVAHYEFAGDRPVFETVNAAFEETFGVDAEAVRGRPLGEVVSPPERSDGTGDVEAHVRDGGDPPREFRRRTAYGVRDFRVAAVPVDAGETAAGFLIAADVTDRKRRERRLQVLNRVLRHDLRNAMNVVLGYVDRLAASTPAAAYTASIIRRRAEEMVELSDKARAIETALHADVTDDPGATDVVPLVRDRVAAARRTHPTLEASADLPDRAPARVHDPDLLATAVDEIVENAVEHAERSDPRLSVAVAVAGDDVRVRFADDGPGVPERELAVLASDWETPLDHLSGVGLWLVKWVVERNDGAVDFETTDEGTVVTLRLPRAAAGA